MFTLITIIKEIVSFVVKRPVKLDKITNYKLLRIVNGDNHEMLTQAFGYVRSKYRWFFEDTAVSGP